MAKLTLNALLAALQGTIGDLVLVREGNNIYVRTRGERTEPMSEPQVAHTSRFGQASRWAKLQLLDPAIKAAYQRACHDHLTPHNVAVGDFMNAPVIQGIGLESYTGKAGETIRTAASDDFNVTRLSVVIRTVAGEILEEGPAEWNPLEKKWLYSSRTQVPPRTTIVIEATAIDLPGNRASAKAYYYVEG
jgi:hypothetical protein